MSKIDLKKDLKQLYSASVKAPVIVEVPTMNFLMLEGAGDPNNSPLFQDLVMAIYSVSYTLKFMIKKEQGIDYGVPPLEGLWYADDMSQFSQDRKDLWKWTVMIMQPALVTGDLVERALNEVAKKKKLAALSNMRFTEYDEGRAAQIMYVGPYCDEGPTILGLHRFIQDQGYQLRGHHHEIYLSDPRRTAPEKLKTIIRQPVE